MPRNGKIKILHLRNSYQYSNAIFGAERVILGICRFANEDEFTHSLVTLIDGRSQGDLPLKKEAEKNHIPVENVRLRHKYDLGAAREIKKLLIKQNIDILHCHDYKSNLIGLFAVRGLNIKVISTVHGYLSVGIKMRLYEILDRYILRYFDKVIAVSDALAHFLKGKVRKNALLVIPNGINVKEFKRETDILKKKKEIGFDEKDLVVGTIGRISPEKGHIYLLKAAKEICRNRGNVKFIIVGDGPAKMKLERWVFKNNLADRIIFTGSIEKIKEVLSVFDVFVLPSRKEAFGLSLLEAMACSKPVIATDVGGIPSIIENDKLGVLIKPRNIGLMSDAILKLLGDENQRLNMGANAQNYVNKKYSIDSMVKAYEKLYRDLAL